MTEFGDEYGLMTPIPSPFNFPMESDVFVGSGDLNYPAQNNELVATEDVNPFKIGLGEQPTYLDSEIEDISSDPGNLNVTMLDWDRPITPAFGNLVVRNDVQRTNFENLIPPNMPQAQQMQQVVKDDQPMMPSDVVPVPAQVSPAAKKSNRGGRRRAQKPTDKDRPCEIAIRKCRPYVEKRKKRTVYTNESVKKTGKSEVAKSNSQRFRQRNTEEEDNLKELMEDKQKDLDTERTVLKRAVLSYNRIVGQFPSKIHRLHCTALDLSQRRLKISTRKEWDNIRWNVDLIEKRNLNQRMLNVEQFFEDDNVDQNGNNAIKLEDEVENALVLEEAENPKRKTEVDLDTMSDKEKRREQNRIASAKCRIREKLRKEIFRNDVRRIWAKWERTKDERQRVANMLLELRNKGTGFVDHAANWIKYLQSVQVDTYYPSPAARANIELDIAEIRELFGQTQRSHQV
ncbi:hypothetical protein WR25_02579 [Diploscapter pachys]|uniref:BZIP domain-containing protein n=1 Tax=Diploscapter pachys TaxID=2018661 RepID=A0A2A2LA69_9BILA|nr:hypothetical protein WR25_02579 [Diploscapter pachys]